MVARACQLVRFSSRLTHLFAVSNARRLIKVVTLVEGAGYFFHFPSRRSASSRATASSSPDRFISTPRRTNEVPFGVRSVHSVHSHHERRSRSVTSLLRPTGAWGRRMSLMCAMRAEQLDLSACALPPHLALLDQRIPYPPQVFHAHAWTIL